MKKYHAYGKITIDDKDSYFDGIVEMGDDVESEYEDLKRVILDRADAPIGAKCCIMSLSLL